MQRLVPWEVVPAIFVLALGAGAQPAPPQILSAQSVFLANGGASCAWSTGPNRAYRDLYTALRQWGGYRLAATPGEADLGFNVSFACPAVPGTVIQGTGTGPAYEPILTLRVLLPQTGALLWTWHEPVQTAVLAANRHRNFDQDIAALVADLQGMWAHLPSGPQPAKRRSEGPPRHLLRIAAAAGAVLMVVLYLVFRQKIHEAAQTFPPLPHPPPFPLF